ncbi:MAG: polysaccharide pyruvyl transferase family protein [Patescibacteria group bacterium]
MWFRRPQGIVFSAHIGTPRENIGDVLSARAIALLERGENTRLFALPKDIGSSANINVTYGGGGMVRPGFGRREVYRDFLLRNTRWPYRIFGVGLNQDVGTPSFSEQDITALNDWVSHAASVTVRDSATKEFLARFAAIDIAIRPCPTYSILVQKHTPQNIARYEIGVVVSFGHTVTYKKFLPQVEALVAGLWTEVGDNNILLICHDEADRTFAKNRFPELQNVAPKTFEEVAQAYSSVKQIISLRGHGVVFAAALRIVCSPVLLCDKMETLYKYHYGVTPPSLTFDVRRHLDYLRRRIVPINLLPIPEYAEITR